MIETAFIHINYIKKEPQSGSFQGMRYLFRKGKCEDGDCLDVFAWPEPLCFVKTPEEQKCKKQFPLTQDGVEEGVRWLNEQYAACTGGRPE